MRDVARLFLSHSSQDRQIADDVASEFHRGPGYEVWLSHVDIHAGASYAEEIWKAIDQSTGLIVLLSEAAVASQQVRREVGLAVGRGIPVFPILLDQGILEHPSLSGDWKYWLHTTQAIPWHGARSVTAAIRSQLAETHDGTGFRDPSSLYSSAPQSVSSQRQVDVVLVAAGELKIGLIKVIREQIMGLGLKETKDLVEAAPVYLQRNVGIDRAREMKVALEAVGAHVELR